MSSHQHRVGSYWDAATPKSPLPPAGAILGWKMLSVTRRTGRNRRAVLGWPTIREPDGQHPRRLLSAMLDDILSPALAATLPPDEFAPTLELKVNSLQPAKPGVLTGNGRVVHRRGCTAFLTGELYNSEGSAVATATARIIYLG